MKPQRITPDEMAAMSEATGVPVEVDGDFAFLTVRPGREYVASLPPVGERVGLGAPDGAA